MFISNKFRLNFHLCGQFRGHFFLKMFYYIIRCYLFSFSFFHFSYQSVPEEKCQTTYEHKCSTTYETSYDTVSRDKCTTEYVNMNLKNIYYTIYLYNKPFFLGKWVSTILWYLWRTRLPSSSKTKLLQGWVNLELISVKKSQTFDFSNHHLPWYVIRFLCNRLAQILHPDRPYQL